MYESVRCLINVRAARERPYSVTHPASLLADTFAAAAAAAAGPAPAARVGVNGLVDIGLTRPRLVETVSNVVPATAGGWVLILPRLILLWDRQNICSEDVSEQIGKTHIPTHPQAEKKTKSAKKKWRRIWILGEGHRG